MKESLKTAEQEFTDQTAGRSGFPGLPEVDPNAARERMVARLRLLWANRRFLFRTTAGGLLLAMAIALLLPNAYESTARLMPPDSQANSSYAMLAALSARGGGLGSFAGDLLGLKSSGALLVGILRSRTVQDGLVERFDLKAVYGVNLLENARRRLSENTSVSEDRKSGIITITITDRSAQRAAAMASAYVSELDRLVAQVSTSAANRERIFLEERLKTVKVELDEAAKEFSEFASENTAIDIKEQGRAMVDAAATLQGQLIAAQTELQGLRQMYTESNVRVRAAHARIAELERQLQKLGGREDSTAGGLTQDSDVLYPSIRKLPLLAVTYADLYRRTKIQEVVYEVLTQQYELAKVQEAKETPTVKVLDEPNVPERKSFPPRMLIMFLGAFLGFAFATVVVLGQARWAETDAEDSGKVFLQEMFSTIKAGVRDYSHNGHGLRGRLLQRLGRAGAHRPSDASKDAEAE